MQKIWRVGNRADWLFLTLKMVLALSRVLMSSKSSSNSALVLILMSLKKFKGSIHKIREQLLCKNNGSFSSKWVEIKVIYDRISQMRRKPKARLKKFWASNLDLKSSGVFQKFSLLTSFQILRRIIQRVQPGYSYSNVCRPPPPLEVALLHITVQRFLQHVSTASRIYSIARASGNPLIIFSQSIYKLL